MRILYIPVVLYIYNALGGLFSPLTVFFNQTNCEWVSRRIRASSYYVPRVPYVLNDHDEGDMTFFPVRGLYNFTTKPYCIIPSPPPLSLDSPLRPSPTSYLRIGIDFGQRPFSKQNTK